MRARRCSSPQQIRECVSNLVRICGRLYATEPGWDVGAAAPHGGECDNAQGIASGVGAAGPTTSGDTTDEAFGEDSSRSGGVASDASDDDIICVPRGVAQLIFANSGFLSLNGFVADIERYMSQMGIRVFCDERLAEVLGLPAGASLVRSDIRLLARRRFAVSYCFE